MIEERHRVNIELRSEEVQDILSRAPHWMIRSGNTILIFIILLLLCLSFFIKYPEIIEGTAVLSTKSPPVYVIPKVKGRITELAIQNHQTVRKGIVLAEIDNPVPLSLREHLNFFLKRSEAFLRKPSLFKAENIESVNLDDAGQYYLDLKNTIEEYSSFLFGHIGSQKLYELKEKQANYLNLKKVSLKEKELNKTEVELAEEKFKVYKKEFESKIIGKLDFLNAQTRYDQSLKLEREINKDIIQTNILLADSRIEMIDFEIEIAEKEKMFKVKIRELIDTLRKYILHWENDFTLKSPIDGRIEFLGTVKNNQFINEGDELFAIFPLDDEYDIQLGMPSRMLEKIKVGQKVKLKLDNFPYEEFGVVIGKIIELSHSPNDIKYSVKVGLTDGLFTSYGIALKYNPEMMATAEVTTNDLRVIERVFDSLRKILKY